MEGASGGGREIEFNFIRTLGARKYGNEFPRNWRKQTR